MLILTREDTLFLQHISNKAELEAINSFLVQYIQETDSFLNEI